MLVEVLAFEGGGIVNAASVEMIMVNEVMPITQRDRTGLTGLHRMALPPVALGNTMAVRDQPHSDRPTGQMAILYRNIHNL